MAGADIPAGNVFDKLPDVLIDDILMQCSLIDRIRAAAACRALFNVYHQFMKQLTSQSVTFNDSNDGNVLRCPQNIGKLQVSLQDDSGNFSNSANIYKEVRSFVERIQSDEALYLSNVHELGIEHAHFYNQTAGQCMQQLLQVLPNLTSVWFGVSGGLEYLSQLDLQPARGICRLGLTMNTKPASLTDLPTLLPRLNTLCLTFYGTSQNIWWLPLSKLPQLRFLSLNRFDDQIDLSNLYQITSLRHLKLETISTIDMRSISGLEKLESLCLCGAFLDYSEATAQLKVTSLTLQSVSLPLTQTQLLHRMAQKCHPAGPNWTRLARVQLAGEVSEKLLQAMLLPHPAAAGITVKVSFDTFDTFDNDHSRKMKQQYRRPYGFLHQLDADIHYTDDATPILGPAYLAAARGATSIELPGYFHYIETLRQLLLLDPKVCRWHKALLRIPLLARIVFCDLVFGPQRITTAHATHCAGATVDEPPSRIYHLRKLTPSTRATYSSKQVFPSCARDVLLPFLLVMAVPWALLCWLMLSMLFA